MLKFLTTHGNSAALVIDKPILELLNLDAKTPLEISTDGGNLVISPIRDASREKKFRAALEKVAAKHAKTFAKLAK
ncbi:MAG: AbrB/MazE/SpoVT family DNA-binding domain-containing protein [Elusimicrobia bacterium]|nr:AbrB/MazE/SpoVT family DNA-binding domain-containing protein [Elusimicrobiota bacterium]